MKIFITRPEDDALPLADRLKKAGHVAVIVPLLKIVPRDGVRIPAGQFQAICLTSANGARCLSGEIDRDVQVLAVGAQSAAAGKARGFRQIATSGGDVHGLVSRVRTSLNPGDGPLLYLSGAETSGDLEGQLKAAGFSITRLITYDAVPQKIDQLRDYFSSGDGVMLYSPRSAKLWGSEVVRLGLSETAKHVTHYCLSAQVAAVLPENFPTRIARSPDETAMLALLDLGSEQE